MILGLRPQYSGMEAPSLLPNFLKSPTRQEFLRNEGSLQERPRIAPWLQGSSCLWPLEANIYKICFSSFPPYPFEPEDDVLQPEAHLCLGPF